MSSTAAESPYPPMVTERLVTDDPSLPPGLFGAWRLPSKVHVGKLSPKSVAALIQPHEIGLLLGGVHPDQTFLRVYFDGVKQPDGALMKRWNQIERTGYVVDMEGAYEALQHRKATLLIRFADTRHLGLGAATQALKATTGYDVVTHVLVSSGGSKGLKPHVDKNIVIWVQAAGKKELARWNDLPFPAKDEAGIPHPEGKPTFTLLGAGDWYQGTPRMVHSARTPAMGGDAPGFSIHIVFIPQIPSLAQFVERTLEGHQRGGAIAEHPFLEALVPPRPELGRDRAAVAFLLRFAARRLEQAGDVYSADIAAILEATKDDAHLLQIADDVYGLRPEADLQMQTALGLPAVDDARVVLAREAALSLV